MLERRYIAKGPSYEIRKKDIVTKHVNGPSAGDDPGGEQALREAEYSYDDF